MLPTYFGPLVFVKDIDTFSGQADAARSWQIQSGQNTQQRLFARA